MTLHVRTRLLKNQQKEQILKLLEPIKLLRGSHEEIVAAAAAAAAEAVRWGATEVAAARWAKSENLFIATFEFLDAALPVSTNFDPVVIARANRLVELA